MALIKIVNGEPVEMSAEEEAAILADRAATATAKAAYVPPSVTPLQMRKALRQLGMIEAVRAMVAAADEATQDEWEYAVQYDRAHPSWEAMGAMMDPPKTAADIDDLFRLAATL